MFKFELLNTEEFFGNTGEVNSPRLKEKRKVDVKTGKKYIDYDPEHAENGLFSDVVFGTAKDYSCLCGRYRGVMENGRVCERCGVKVQSASARRFTYGHIKVGIANSGFFLVCPEVFKLLLQYCVTDRNLKNLATNVLNGKISVDMSTDPPMYVSSLEHEFTGPLAFKDAIYPLIVEKMKDDITDEKILNEIFPMIDRCLFTSIIPVVPPDLRPVTSGGGTTCFIDELNKIYMVMLTYIKHINESPTIPYDKLASLQQQYFLLSDILLKKLSSKSGLMRKYILGKRVDYSGRSVIVPDPTLDLEQVDVSFYIIKEIFQPAILPKLAEKLHISELEAMNQYESAKFDDVIFDICKEYEGYPVIINRQPTLHKAGMFVLYIRHILKDYVIAIAPVFTLPLNADFDGDQVAIYAPIGGAAYTEAASMTPSNNMTLPSNGELAFGFDEDLVLGLYRLSMTEEGRQKIYDSLDDDVKLIIKPFIEKSLTGKNLQEFFSILVDSIEEKRIEPIINKLAHLSTSESVISVSLLDFKNAAPDNADNPASLMVIAGARGKWSQIKQIQTRRGFVSDVLGNVIPTSIESSLLDGLTNQEFFASSYGARKGLIDTSRNTSLSGYLTRRLVYITSGLELHYSMDDCGTDHYLTRILDEDNYKLYLYRYFKDPDTNEEFVLTKFNWKDKLHKVLLMRSPMTCKCEGNKICHKCYGLLFRKHKSKQIGYIAAQSLGERAAQLTLRTKHISGVTDINLPSWCKIENGWVITEIPTVITITPDSIIISNQTETDEFEIGHATINITAPNIVKESNDEIVIDEDDGNIVDVETRINVNDTGKIGTIVIKSHDVVTAVGEFSRFLRNLPEQVEEDPSMTAVLDKVLSGFGFSGIHAIHYELILSNFCRNLTDNKVYYRHKMNEPYIWIKEKNVFENSLLQGMIFERFSQKLNKLLVSDKNDAEFKNSILSKLTCFNFDQKGIIDNCKETWFPEN